ncbi:MAG: hypothetical protein IKC82_05555, partial [Lentisphaeria bacterium]|nr:hypothetical protein [Lentisphaeria bacterium]
MENFVFPAVAFSFCLCSFFAFPQKMGLLTYVWVAVALLRLVGLCPPSTPVGDAILFLNARSVVPNPCKKQATALENFVFPAVAFSFCLCSFFA